MSMGLEVVGSDPGKAAAAAAAPAGQGVLLTEGTICSMQAVKMPLLVAPTPLFRNTCPLQQVRRGWGERGGQQQFKPPQGGVGQQAKRAHRVIVIWVLGGWAGRRVAANLELCQPPCGQPASQPA